MAWSEQPGMRDGVASPSRDQGGPGPLLLPHGPAGHKAPLTRQLALLYRAIALTGASWDRLAEPLEVDTSTARRRHIRHP